MTDPLDRLLRDAAGTLPDPEPSRRAIRAVLHLGIERRRRRDARARARFSLFISALLLAAMFRDVGSDDFAITSESIPGSSIAADRRTYRQGMRGESLRSSRAWTDRNIEEWFQQQALGQGVPVALRGWQVGQVRHLSVETERNINGDLVCTGEPVQGPEGRESAVIRSFLAENGMANFVRLLEARDSRAPDLRITMYAEDLVWKVDGWIMAFPKYGRVVYYEGLRADGVRAQGGSPF